jgi:hypothetical protein
MKVYRVKLQRVVWQECEMEVVANTEEEALDVSWEEARAWQTTKSLRSDGFAKPLEELVTA